MAFNRLQIINGVFFSALAAIQQRTSETGEDAGYTKITAKSKEQIGEISFETYYHENYTDISLDSFSELLITNKKNEYLPNVTDFIENLLNKNREIRFGKIKAICE
jgi:hypothetical protein